MRKIWLARHAHRLDFIRPEWFDTAIYPYDPPLSETGLEQSISLARKLSQAPINSIFTSPFLRTIQTAHPLSRLLKLPIRLEWGLCEWLCQDWTPSLPQTTPLSNLKADYPNIDLSYKSLVAPCYPETSDELNARLAIIADRLIRGNPQNILAIAHKGSVLGIVAALTGENGWQTYELACGELIELVYTNDCWVSSIIDR